MIATFPTKMSQIGTPGTPAQETRFAREWNMEVTVIHAQYVLQKRVVSLVRRTITLRESVMCTVPLIQSNTLYK